MVSDPWKNEKGLQALGLLTAALPLPSCSGDLFTPLGYYRQLIARAPRKKTFKKES